jgi:hypothetical protein
MHETCRFAARAHAAPTVGRKVVKGGFAENRTAGIAGTQKKNIHGFAVSSS